MKTLKITVQDYRHCTTGEFHFPDFDASKLSTTDIIVANEVTGDSSRQVSLELIDPVETKRTPSWDRYFGIVKI